MEKNYLVRFDMAYEDFDGTSIIPVITEVHVSVAYWDDICQEQREEEIISFAISNLEDVGLIIDEERIKNIEVKEF
jgi:hypothetical protein